MEPTALRVTVSYDGGLHATTLLARGVVAGTTATAVTWTAPFAVPIPAHGSTLGGGLFDVSAAAAWAWQPAALHRMRLSGAITGVAGCPGSASSMDMPVAPAGYSTTAGGMSAAADDGVFEGNATCPDGSVPTATFTVTVTLAPGG